MVPEMWISSNHLTWRMSQEDFFLRLVTVKASDHTELLELHEHHKILCAALTVA
jgi:hypothetical protein